ncbi:ribosome maturation factor RimM [Leucobacter sp. HNU]|uniref:ribosome maturation factor RimM n=1 Tax=Leucobacter sp. HNU TaxID=3236805 RepID=UPI003A80F229
MSAASGRAKAPRPAQGAGSLRVGRLTKPHGLKGGVKIELYTDNPELRFVPGAVFQLQVPEDSQWFGRTLTLRELRWFNETPVAFFEELPDRTAVESSVRAILWIDEDAVAAGAEENAWYDHQLVGLSVRREDPELGTVELGTVAEVQHFPAQDLLSVHTPSGTVLVPFVEAIVPSVDPEAGVVIVTPPPGLFDESAAIEAGGPASGGSANADASPAEGESGPTA